MAGLLFWKKKCFKVGFERIQRRFLSERTGKVIQCRGTEEGKGTRTNSGKSGTRNLQAESIRGREESTGRMCEVENSHRDMTHTNNPPKGQKVSIKKRIN